MNRFLESGVSAIALIVAAAPVAAAAQTSPAPAQLPAPNSTTDAPDASVAPPANSPVAAQADPEAQTGVEGEAIDDAGGDIVVTGFRGSLNTALSQKRNDAGVIDTILAEDIGKFPDSNLAESMQRVPGVALARGDGGEGRQITVRGLPPLFTRVLVGGMQANSQVAQTDINNTAGGSSRSRAFDFSAYPSEIFSGLTVRKTSSAETEEGSLGATVELRAPRPFDYKDDFVLSASAKATYGDLNEKVGPRLSAVVAGQSGAFGALLGVAYTQRQTRDEGYAPSNILNATSDQGFCSPIGFAPQNPANNALRGATPTMCGTGVPRTSTAAAYQAVSRADVFLPRLPRYMRSDQDYERLGVTASLQWQPDDDTDVSLDGIYTRFDVKRRDNYIMGLSFGRGLAARGKPETSIVEANVTSLGTLDYGLFNGVDVVSQVYQNNYVSDLKQLTFNYRRRLNDALEVSGKIGVNQSRLREPLRANVISYANNVNGFRFDIRDSDFALIDFGFDINDPARFVYAPNSAADGTITSQATANRGGSTTDETVGEVNLLWDAAPWLKIRAGGQYRRSEFVAFDEARNSAVNPALPAGVTLASISRSVTGFGKGLRDGVPTAWTGIDWDKFVTTFDFFNNPAFRFFGPADGQNLGNNYAIDEDVKAAYVQAEFDEQVGGIRVRGNAGVRYVRTDQTSFGFVSGVGVVPVKLNRGYDDWLPSLNLAADLTDKLTIRLAEARVMARPDLPQLSPGTSIQPPTRTANVGNPFLEPTRATTVDVSLEWYFTRGSLLSGGFFYKDIDSYVQSLTRTIPFSQTGFPDSLLQGQPVRPADLFAITSRVNTPGGPLRGFEINYQQQFHFLPGPLKNLGTLFNYTRVTSDIDYILNQATGVTATFPLVGLSKDQVNGTLYYEDSKFSLRGSVNYRSQALRAVPSGSTSVGSDVDLIAPTLYADFSASYAISDRFRVTLEGRNLTDEHVIYYVDSRRKDVLYNVHSGRTFEAGISFTF